MDEEGKISFNGEGTATITVESKYEKEGGGKMEESIAVQVNAPPENTTGLEVVSFRIGKYMDYPDDYLIYVVKNVSLVAVTTRIVDVYYLDESNKILGSGTLLLVSSMTPITINANEEIERVDNPAIVPNGTKKILIYNSRVSGMYYE